MTRTHEEIKKGLMCCMSLECAGEECPYFHAKSCNSENRLDALDYMQQLEEERDAAVKDIRLAFTSYPGACETCEHVDCQLECDVAVGCSCCENKKCVCNTCDNDYCNWQWRGVQKEE